MKQPIIFSVKVWLTTILLSPVLRLFMQYIFNLKISGFNLDSVSYFEAAAFLGFCYSFPAAIALSITVLFLNKTMLPEANKKFIISMVAFIAILLISYFEFWIIEADEFSVNFYMTLPYVIASMGSIWFYRLKSQNEV